MRTQVKFLCVSLLLGVALVCMVLSAAGTIRAYQQLEQNHQRIMHGDVSLVSSWMTIPYVARVYRVPEVCFSQSLKLSDPWLMHHATLRVIADRSRQPVIAILHNVQYVILAYRDHRLHCTSSSFPHPPGANFVSLHFLPCIAWEETCR